MTVDAMVGSAGSVEKRVSTLNGKDDHDDDDDDDGDDDDQEDDDDDDEDDHDEPAVCLPAQLAHQNGVLKTKEWAGHIRHIG